MVYAKVQGMAFTMSSSLGITEGYTATPTDTNADGILDAVTFNFGNLINTPDGVSQVLVLLPLLPLLLVVLRYSFSSFFPVL